MFEGLVEGVFSRAFSSEVQPVELARKLAKEMDAHKTASVQRVYVPNEYTVFLSRQDRGKLEGYERSLEQELSGYLLEHARRRGYDLLTRPAGRLRDRRAAAARRVRDPGAAGEAARARGRRRPNRAKRATRWSTRRCASATAAGRNGPSRRSARWSRPARSSRSATAATCSTARGRRSGARSRSSACSPTPTSRRRHAELRRDESGDWQIVDLGSTNGIKVNGRRVPSTRLSPGDQVTVGTTTFTFDIEQ